MIIITHKKGVRAIEQKKSHGKHITCNNKRQSCGNRLNKKCVASFLFIILQWFVNKHNDLAINQSTTAEKNVDSTLIIVISQCIESYEPRIQ